jgi:hypothetical protein
MGILSSKNRNLFYNIYEIQEKENSMKKEILDELYTPFKLEKRPGQGNKIFEYVPSEDILDRMNRAFQGNWSTEVVEHKVVEDHVVMLVRVIVEDPDTGRWHAHDGWASHPIMRYTGGSNSGKVIDLGNTYKSAMSKAIKSAVSRWGVDLKREESGHTSAPASEGPPSAGSPGPAPKKEEPVASAPPIPNFPTAPPAEKKPEAAPMNVPPIFTDNNVISEPETAAPVAAPSAAEEIPMLTDVQRVAIEHIMELQSLSFEALTKTALGRETDLPATLDEVKYPDAVMMISYGNHLSLQQ